MALAAMQTRQDLNHCRRLLFHTVSYNDDQGKKQNTDNVDLVSCDSLNPCYEKLA